MGGARSAARRAATQARRFVGSPRSDRWVSVAGAVGPDSERLAEHAVAATWTWRVSAVGRRGQRVTLLASDPVPALRMDDGWYWNPVDRCTTVVTRAHAQHEALAASCVDDPAGWVVANDALGVQPLFYAVVQRTLWFSTSARVLIDLVSDVVASNLDADGPDPAGWQSIILLGFPPPGDSAFRSLRTLLPGESIGIRDDGRLTSDVALPAAASVPRRSIDDLLDALRSSLPPSGRAVDVPLSGGWDSRLLAALLAERRPRRMTSWTTTVGDGIELDLALAPAVARHLRIEHRSFVDESASWPELATDVVHRTDYQTWMHAWLLPLADHLRRQGTGTVVDGFGGDFVLRRLFQTAERDASPSSEARHDIWVEMGGGRASSDVVWSEEARRWFATGASFESFDRSVVGLADHPNWQALTVITTRATRCIGLAPFRLIEPEIVVATPFLSAAVRDVLFSESIYLRRGPDLYRSILAALDAELASLPTTNDADLVRARTRDRRETSVESLTAMAIRIAANDDAMRLLAPRLREAVRTCDVDALTALTAYVVPLRALQAAHALAQWHLDHPAARAGIWTD